MHLDSLYNPQAAISSFHPQLCQQSHKEYLDRPSVAVLSIHPWFCEELCHCCHLGEECQWTMDSALGTVPIHAGKELTCNSRPNIAGKELTCNSRPNIAGKELTCNSRPNMFENAYPSFLQPQKDCILKCPTCPPTNTVSLSVWCHAREVTCNPCCKPLLAVVLHILFWGGRHIDGVGGCHAGILSKILEKAIKIKIETRMK